MRALRHSRPRLTLDAAKSVAVTTVGTRLDYSNSLLHGTSQRNLDRLQRLQNSLTRVVTQAPHRTSDIELRRQLQWLPIRQHIESKLGIITFRESGLPTLVFQAIWRVNCTVINRRGRCALALLPSCIGLTHPWTSTDIPSQSWLRLSGTSLLLFVIPSA